jgi:hypothetical protein
MDPRDGREDMKGDARTDDNAVWEETGATKAAAPDIANIFEVQAVKARALVVELL